MLTYKAIHKLIANGVIKNVHPDQVNPASLDVTLGEILMIEDCCGQDVDPLTRQGPRMRRLRKIDGKWRLKPGVFALCSTREIFNMPDDLDGLISRFERIDPAKKFDCPLWHRPQIGGIRGPGL